MTLDQAVDWALRACMAALTFWVFQWGKTQKQGEQLLASQFELRDSRIDEILRRLDHAGQKSSDEANRVMVKLNEHSERLLVTEMKIKDRRTHEQERRMGSENRRD